MNWPFMLKSVHRAVQLENYTLRDALRESNRELEKHRRLLAGLRSGQIDIVQTLERMSSSA